VVAQQDYSYLFFPLRCMHIFLNEFLSHAYLQIMLQYENIEKSAVINYNSLQGLDLVFKARSCNWFYFNTIWCVPPMKNTFSSKANCLLYYNILKEYLNESLRSVWDRSWGGRIPCLCFMLTLVPPFVLMFWVYIAHVHDVGVCGCAMFKYQFFYCIKHTTVLT
jgi:hypothetical protein